MKRETKTDTAMSDPRLKQIKIKTGVLKRVGKEKLSYRKEADQQKVKIEKMKDSLFIVDRKMHFLIMGVGFLQQLL